MTSKLMLDAQVEAVADLEPVLDAAQAICTSYERDCTASFVERDTRSEGNHG